MRLALTGATPFPNILLDEVMPRLKDTEWRLLCVIVRQTLGWQDEKSGSRKERDWLTRSQLRARTGRHAEALTAAIEALVRQGYIVVQDGEGRALSSALKRRAHRGRSYYALGESWRQRIGLTSSFVTRETEPLPRSTCSIFGGELRKSEHAGAGKANGTKETFTKRTLTKEKPAKVHHEFSGENCHRNRDNESTGKDSTSTGNISQDKEAAMFIALFKATARRSGISNPQSQLSLEELCRLKAWLTGVEESSRWALLEKYFQSRLPYILHREYSLQAFLHTRHILPLQRNLLSLGKSAPVSLAARSL